MSTFKLERLEDDDNYLVNILQSRVGKALVALPQTLSIMDQASHICLIKSIDELRALTADYGDKLNQGDIAALINTYDGTSRLFFWIDNNIKWQEIILAQVPSNDTKASGFDYEINTEADLTSITDMKNNDTAIIMNYNGTGSPSIAVYNATEKAWKFLAAGSGPAVTPIIKSFTSSVTDVLLGNTVDSLTLSWDYNFNPTSQSINNGVGTIEKTLRTITLSALGLVDSKTYTLSVVTGSNTLTANASIRFANNIYWGVDNRTAINLSSDILLLNKKLQNSKSTSQYFSCVSQYIYIAYPSKYGNAIFKVNGLLNTAWIQSKLNVTNEAGYTEEYNVYRSYYIQNGSDILVEVN
jgi:hypothetical protein